MKSSSARLSSSLIIIIFVILFSQIGCAQIMVYKDLFLTLNNGQRHHVLAVDKSTLDTLKMGYLFFYDYDTKTLKPVKGSTGFLTKDSAGIPYFAAVSNDSAKYAVNSNTAKIALNADSSKWALKSDTAKNLAVTNAHGVLKNDGLGTLIFQAIEDADLPDDISGNKIITPVQNADTASYSFNAASAVNSDYATTSGHADAADEATVAYGLAITNAHGVLKNDGLGTIIFQAIEDADLPDDISGNKIITPVQNADTASYSFNAASAVNSDYATTSGHADAADEATVAYGLAITNAHGVLKNDGLGTIIFQAIEDADLPDDISGNKIITPVQNADTASYSFNSASALNSDYATTSGHADAADEATVAYGLSITNAHGFLKNDGTGTLIYQALLDTDIIDALGYTPLETESDPTIYTWAKASTKPSYTFSEIGSKPTTISGYGITDAITTANIGSQSVADATNWTGSGGGTSGSPKVEWSNHANYSTYSSYTDALYTFDRSASYPADDFVMKSTGTTTSYTVVTDVQVTASGLTYKLQKKTRTITLEDGQVTAVGTESAWTDSGSSWIGN